MVPENVTSVPRAPQDLSGDFGQERLAKLRHGETLRGPAARQRRKPRSGERDHRRLWRQTRANRPPPKDKRSFSNTTASTGPKKRVASLAFPSTPTNSSRRRWRLTIAANTRRWPSIAQRTGPQRAKPADEGDNEGGMNLYEALYETALKQGLPRPIVDELVKAFLNDVDFQRSVQPGDSLVAFTADPDEFESRPTLLYAALTVRDQTFRYYRFETPDDKVVDYYDENGRSSRKFLLRKPIAAGEMSFAVRHAVPPDPALRAAAQRRRLGRAGGHADCRGGQRRRSSRPSTTPVTAAASKSNTPTAM